MTRTWQLQLGIFWIATSWLATGLYIAPAVLAKPEPLDVKRLGWGKMKQGVAFGLLLAGTFLYTEFVGASGRVRCASQLAL